MRNDQHLKLFEELWLSVKRRGIAAHSSYGIHPHGKIVLDDAKARASPRASGSQ